MWETVTFNQFLFSETTEQPLFESNHQFINEPKHLFHLQQSLSEDDGIEDIILFDFSKSFILAACAAFENTHASVMPLNARATPFQKTCSTH